MRLNPLAAAMAQKPMQSVALNMSPQTALPEPPKNALLQGIGAAIDGFQRGFDPKGWQAGKDEAKAAEGEKLKQTLALMQQQRALPEQQRGQWWQQNAPMISKIIGQDVSQMPLDVTKFSDQALDGQIAALSAQMGIGPATPEPMSAYEAAQIRLREQELAKTGEGKLTTQVGGNGNYWSFNTSTGKMEDTGVQAPPEKVNGETGSGLANGGVHSKERMEDGRILVTYRNGKQEIAIDPSTGQPAIASDSFFAFDAGGVPVIGSRRSGDATPYTTAEEVGTNAAIIEGFKFLGKEQADAISVMPEAISTANRAIASIDELLNAPGFRSAYGVERFYPQNQLPGSDAQNAQAIIKKLDGQFFVNAVTAMQVSLAPVSDADALRLVASVSQLSNLNISPDEAARVAKELKDYFRKAQEKAIAAAQRGPIKTPLANAPQQTPPKSWVSRQAERFQSLAPKPAAQVPEGVDPEDWKYMTDNQKALFQ